MKGIIFREFLEMVERRFGYAYVDHILENPELESRGIYTSVGTYPSKEFATLAGQVCSEKNIPGKELMFDFGQHLFTAFGQHYRNYLSQFRNMFHLLENLDQIIHVHVKKIHPDAMLPEFTVLEKTDQMISMFYHSPRKMEDLAAGLLTGCAGYYGIKVSIDKQSTEGEKPGTLFTINLESS